MTAIEFTTDKREYLGGWTRNCRVGGVDYCVSVKRKSHCSNP